MGRPTELKFGSFLVYPSKASTDEMRKFKRTVLHIKEDYYHPEFKMRMPEYTAKRLAEELPDSPLKGFFKGAVLVPIPRSGLLQKHSLWPAKRICEALVRYGIATRFEAVLERKTPIRKSAGAPERPPPQEHYDSLEVLLSMPSAKTIVLVDDVITRGSTALGAAWRLLERLPEVDFRAFAVARTMTAYEGSQLIDIQVGTIKLLDGDNSLTREP